MKIMPGKKKNQHFTKTLQTHQGPKPTHNESFSKMWNRNAVFPKNGKADNHYAPYDRLIIDFISFQAYFKPPNARNIYINWKQ